MTDIDIRIIIFRKIHAASNMSECKMYDTFPISFKQFLVGDYSLHRPIILLDTSFCVDCSYLERSSCMSNSDSERLAIILGYAEFLAITIGIDCLKYIAY